MYVLELKIDGLPKPTNRTNVHWRVRHAHAQAWKTKVFSHAWPLKPAHPLTSAALTLTRGSSHPTDFDGLVSSFKHVIDGLVQARVIIDDKMSVIGQPKYEWVKAPRKQGFISIKVVQTTKEQQDEQK